MATQNSLMHDYTNLPGAKMGYANEALQRQFIYREIGAKVERELARRRLMDFAQYLNPTYTMYPHHKLICEYLDRYISGEIRRLIISMPPGHAKSEYASVLLPAFLLGLNPQRRIIHSSYASSLSNDFSRKVRGIVRDSELYRQLFPQLQLDPDRQRVDDWHLMQGGSFFSVGVQGGVTGHRANDYIIDDPVKEGDETSLTTLQEIFDWLIKAALTRLLPGAGVVMLMTRWHPLDPAGRLLDLAKHDPAADQWTYLRLPGLAEDNDPMGRQPGEALWPEWYPRQRFLAMKAASERYFEALIQQNPKGGDQQLFYDSGFKRQLLAWPLRKESAAWTFDLAITEKDESDYNVLARWSYDKRTGDLYVSNIRRFRSEWPKTKKLIMRMMRVFKNDVFVFPPHIMELMAVQELKHDRPADAARVIGLKREDFKGDKRALASVLADKCAAGHVYVQHGKHSERFISEHVNFPDQHDDCVDNSSVATHYFGLHNEFKVWVSKTRQEIPAAAKAIIELAAAL